MEAEWGEAYGDPTPGELAAIEGMWLPDRERAAVREYWERVMASCRAQVVDRPWPTSWLATRTEEQRRARREARRATAGVVRELPVRRGGSGPDGREAA